MTSPRCHTPASAERAGRPHACAQLPPLHRTGGGEVQALARRGWWCACTVMSNAGRGRGWRGGLPRYRADSRRQGAIRLWPCRCGWAAARGSACCCTPLAGLLKLAAAYTSGPYHHHHPPPLHPRSPRPQTPCSLQSNCMGRPVPSTDDSRRVRAGAPPTAPAGKAPSHSR